MMQTYQDQTVPKRVAARQKKPTQISTISNTESKGKPVDHKILLGATYIIIYIQIL